MRTFLRPGLQALRTMDSKAPMHPANAIPEDMPKEMVAAHSGLDFKIGETHALMMDPISGSQLPDRSKAANGSGRWPRPAKPSL